MATSTQVNSDGIVAEHVVADERDEGTRHGRR